MKEPVIIDEIDLTVQHYALKDSSGTTDFTGVQIGHISTERPSSPRWTVMDLYRIEEPQTSAHYVLDIQGRSVLYHIRGGTCNTGITTAVADLPDDSEACPKCLPDGADDSATVEMEINQQMIVPCDGVIDVINELRDQRTKQLSRPAQRLLAAAMEVDEAFNPANVVNHL